MTKFSPNALCFGEELPASGAPCFVQVEGHGLTITFERDGGEGAQEMVPFPAFSVSAGGLDHDHLVLKWGEAERARTLYLKNPHLIRAFRDAAPDHLSQPFEQAAERVRQVRHRHRVMWGTVGGAIAAVALALWFGADLLVEMAVSRIPVEWEQKLGEAAYRDFLSHQEVIKEGPAVKAVEEITQRLAEQVPNNPYKFQVTVVKSDVVNAFALPGGYVVVFTGLMKKAESGEEVAGVLGHELNHVLQRHGLERIVKNMGVMAVVAIIVGDQQGLIGLMRQVGVELLTLKFDRAQETEADLTGLQLVYRAKIDPAGMITFFQKLSEKDDGRLEWLSTHPMSSARAERLKVELAALPKRSPEPFTFEWTTVQSSLGVQPVAAP
ncbi:M48 family metallopeptidase [Nitrospira sp. NS4]|uniref:M48 family metallopeptidase n=1 Tax=Nitrospira sp. NS4 TaxID=3414498 RepID=UPI003C2EFB2D